MENGRKWEDLEADHLVNIFQRLDLEDLTLGLPFVCKSWYRASLNPILWEYLNFRDIDLRGCQFVARFKEVYRLEDFSATGFMKFAINRGRRSTCKVILPGEGVTLEDWTFVSQECPTLKILVFPTQMKEEEEKHIPHFISKWKELQWLCMESIPSSFNEMLMEINAHCKDFMGLVTRGRISDEEAMEIVKFLPTIKFLYLRGSFISKETLMKIIEGCRELKVLDVKDCLGLEVDDETLKKASGIETFVYGGSLFEQNDDNDDDDDDGGGDDDNGGSTYDIIIFY